MQNVIVKTVDFQGAELIAGQREDDRKIFVGVGYICNGIGLTEGQKKRQITNIQKDIVLKQGCCKFDTGVFDPNNETLGIDIEFLPLWLAKISITPKMQQNNPETTKHLVEYQLKAKDVLAAAFINQEKKDSYMIEDKIERAQRWIEEAKEKQALLEKLEEQQPAVDFANAISGSKDSIAVSALAKILKQNGYDTGQKKLFTWFRNEGYLCSTPGRNYNLPVQRYINQGLFEIKESTYEAGDKKKIALTTKVTVKGQEYFINKLCPKKKIT